MGIRPFYLFLLYSFATYICSIVVIIASIYSFLGLRIIGRISVNRMKRSSSPTHNNEIHIETPKVIFDHQYVSNDENGTHVIEPLVLQLNPTTFPLIGPNYKLVVRDGQDEIVINQTVSMPKCLFKGKLKGNENVSVAISTCDQKRIVSTHIRWISDRNRNKN